MKVISGMISLSLFISLFAPYAIAATAEDTFTSSLTVFETNDVTPPSIPANLIATAVSDESINLSWTASTDDTSVGGYRIFRDSFVISTTTSTNYSDTGLIQLTEYAYNVEAFDAVYNYSGLSSAASTTTLASPTSGQGQSQSGSGSTILKIFSIDINPQLDRAHIKFETSYPTRARLEWGKTSDLETGSILSIFYDSKHNLSIGDLDPGTDYYLKITATDYRSVQTVENVTFRTKSVEANYPLPNPSGFRASAGDSFIDLNWINPRDNRFDGVRIVRSESFFPKDEYDGEVVYEGSASSFRDENTLPGTLYYYAIFSKDKNGKFSSGALAQARVNLSGEIVISPTSTDPFIDLPISENVDPMLKGLTLSDFEFYQEGKRLNPFGKNMVAINGSENLTIRLKYEKVPEILKTVAFTLTSPTDSKKVFTFLLRVNEDRTYYEATIGELGQSGDYKMNVVILDYKNKGMKRIEGSLVALAFKQPMDMAEQKDFTAIAILIVMILIILSLLTARRHKKANEN